MGNIVKGLDREAAREEVLRVYGASLKEILDEQVRLALSADDEAVRAKVGGSIVGLVAFPDSAGNRPAAAVQVISNIHLPEYRMPGGVQVEHPALEASPVVSEETKPRKLIQPALEHRAEWAKDPEKAAVHVKQ